MSNIISSDWYRVSRGAALRNTFVGLVALVVLIMVIMLIGQSGAGEVLVVPEGMNAAEAAELQQDLADIQQETVHIDSGAVFSREMLAQFFIPFFFVAVAIAVFCADFSAGTYRNTLSYESNRSKVYLGKLLLSVVLCLGLVLAVLLFSWLVGSFAFGFGGISVAYFVDIGTVLLLQLPVMLGFVAVCHCLVAFTKKSSATIAIFLVGYIGLAILLQVLPSMIPGLDWMTLLDPQSSGKLMAMYSEVPAGNIIFIVVYHTVIAVVATILGLLHYRKADMP